MHIAPFAPAVLVPCPSTSCIPVSRASQRAGSEYPALACWHQPGVGIITLRAVSIPLHSRHSAARTSRPLADPPISQAWRACQSSLVLHSTKSLLHCKFRLLGFREYSTTPLPSSSFPPFHSSPITRIVECSLHCSGAVHRQWCWGKCKLCL